MFFIGLAAGALLTFILITIYSSLAIASRSDKQEFWDIYEDEFIMDEELIVEEGDNYEII